MATISRWYLDFLNEMCISTLNSYLEFLGETIIIENGIITGVENND